MKGISVIICCHNSEKRIGDTLKNIAMQACQFDWEVLVVDNNCTDSTVEIVKNFFSNVAPNVTYTLLVEKRPGLSFARECGINAAKFDIIVFCDDDNWLRNDYLENASHLFHKFPDVAILGGEIKPFFETNEPDWFKDYAGGYAVGQNTQNDLTYKKWVYGAGMLVRTNVIYEIKKHGFRSYLTGRIGKNLSAGDDSELCYQAQLLGYKIASSNLLQMQHFIPEGRLKLDYAINLYKGFGSSLPVLKYYGALLEDPNTKYDLNHRLKQIFNLLSQISLARFIFYRLFVPNHFYLRMPHVIMSVCAVKQYFKLKSLADEG